MFGIKIYTVFIAIFNSFMFNLAHTELNSYISAALDSQHVWVFQCSLNGNLFNFGDHNFKNARILLMIEKRCEQKKKKETYFRSGKLVVFRTS